MSVPILILALAVAAGLSAITGVWRRMLTPFQLQPKGMTVARLALGVRSPENVERVDTILKSFAGGFNAALTGASRRAYERFCEGLPALYRPFAEEGVAMGYTPRNLFLYRPSAFERTIVRPRPEFRYLYYVGLGFWSGIRGHSARRLAHIVEGLDPLHRYLCFDGLGFKLAFFNYRRDAAVLEKLDVLPGYARNAAYQGVGRALYFLFMDEPDALVEHLSRLGECAGDAAAGVALAAVFVNPDRLRIAQDLADRMPGAWQGAFHLGMCFALKARSINDLTEFERNVAQLERPLQDAVWASIRECDRVELQVRADGLPDGYRRWREQVTRWMTENIVYPLREVRPSAARVNEGALLER